MKNYFLLSVLAASSMFYGCKEEETPTTDKCASKNITIVLESTKTPECSNLGQITVTASGSTGFTYQLNNGAFQSSPTFSNLSGGTYTVTVKDVDGCTKSITDAVTTDMTRGSLYTAVKNLIVSKCNNACHTAGTDGAPKDIFSTDCKIIERKSLIVTKSVDESMGSLTTNEKKVITDWIAAGGTINQ